jgi:hypothetical protein
LLPPRERDFLKLLFRGKAECSRFLFSLTCLSCVFFKKVAENRSLFWAVFLHSRESKRAFSTTKPLSNDQFFLYLFINSFTHNNTYYKTTRIKIHHSLQEAQKNANAIVFAAALSLSNSCCYCLNAKERALLSFFKSDIHRIIFLSSVDNIKRREEYDFRKREIQR